MSIQERLEAMQQENAKMGATIRATTITPGYMSQPEAAMYLNVSDSTFEEWIRSKKLPFYRPSWERRFKKEDLDNWMSSYRDVRRKQRKPRQSTTPTTVACPTVQGAANSGSTS